MDIAELQITKSKFNVMKEQPESLLLLVDKFVTIELIKNISFSGFLYSVDPISYSMIILVPSENTFQTTLIPGHAIVDVTETGTTLNPPSRKEVDNKSDLDIPKKKQKMVAWLKKNLLEVTETGENIVIGNVSVLPPYNVSDISTENPVVASQIRRVMENMPQDFKPL